MDTFKRNRHTGKLSLPKGMLIDLDDTLISAEADRKYCWETINREFRNDVENIVEITRYASDWLRWFWSDPGRHRTWRFDLRGARALGLKQAMMHFGISDSITAERISDRFSELRESKNAILPGAVETLEFLSDRGTSLALVTNGNAYMQRNKIRKFGLEKHFDYIFIEGEKGYGKPDERAYLNPLDQLGLSAVEAWMVGDKYEWEVEVPQKLGMKAVWINRKKEAVPEKADPPFMMIEFFSEIEDIIGPG